MLCWYQSSYQAQSMKKTSLLAKQRVKFWITKVGALLTKGKHKNEETQTLSTSGTYPFV